VGSEMCIRDREKEAVRLGARDFLVRPFGEEQLELAIRRHLALANDNSQTRFASEDIEQLTDDTFFVGASPVMQKLRAQAELLAQADVPVLIVGEPGSGRDTTGHLIHKLSVRSEFRFLKVNCAALPGDLLEKELFGDSGSVGRSNDRCNRGKFQLCDGGTIFLDRIVNMPVGMQEKLLRLMETKQIMGPETGDPIDVRVLAATDVNLEKALSDKTLREDLYYRLSAFTVHVPPLRQRKDEIPFLLRHCMHKLARHYGLPARELSPAALEASQRYPWPGNMRELENFVKRYLMIGDLDLSTGWSDAEHPTDVTQLSGTRSMVMAAGSRDESDQSTPAPKSLKSLIKNVKSEAERNAIAAALEKTGWNRKAAARLLSVSYRTILYKIEQYNMTLSENHSSPFADPGFKNGEHTGGQQKDNLIRLARNPRWQC